MHGGEADTEADDDGRGGDTGPCWHLPLDSTATVRLLIDLVLDRLDLRAPSGTARDGYGDGRGVVEVDEELGVVRALDQSWSAALAPLAARLAGVPPDGWSEIVYREVERWHRAIRAVERHTSGDEAAGPGSGVGPVVLRLTAATGAPPRTTQPAFGETVWELVLDLGSSGYVSLTPGSDPADRDCDQRWRGFAHDTVERHETRWAHLVLDDDEGVVLSGPFVSALLHDPDLLRARLEPPLAGTRLRVTVFTNSLVLITPGRPEPRSTPAAMVTESLHRFTSVLHRRFEPFTVDLGDPDDRPDPGSPS